MNHPEITNSPIAGFITGFFRDQGLPAEEITLIPIPGDGSKRDFWRAKPGESDISFIAMENTPTDAFSRRENIAYLNIGRHLFQKGLPLPEIYRFDLTSGWFIMEDMGDNNLQDTLSQTAERTSIYKNVINILFMLQIEGAQGFNTEWCCQTEKYDRSLMRRYEADYFRDAFLRDYLDLKKDWTELEGPFNHLAETASRAESRFFLHRDFQSRNIMVSDGKIGIIDWQGGRLGPLAYDLASLLLDPYTELTAHEKDHLYQYYLRRLGDYRPEEVDPFKEYFPYLAIQRNLQILGAFSFLSKVRGKSYFEAYIPSALKSLRALLHELRDPNLSPLMDTVNSLPDTG